jgi:hypothetical protein
MDLGILSDSFALGHSGDFLNGDFAAGSQSGCGVEMMLNILDALFCAVRRNIVGRRSCGGNQRMTGALMDVEENR